MNCLSSPHSGSIKVDALSWVPVVGTIVGVGRCGVGTVKVGVNGSKYVKCRLLHQETTRTKEAASDGLKMVGRGLLETIPIIGNIAAYSMDSHKLYPLRNHRTGLIYYNPTTKGVYTGPIKHGKPFGVGRYRTAAGVYEGEFANVSVFMGQTVNYDPRDVELFFLHDGCSRLASWGREGKGTMTYTNGARYEGDWHLGLRSGHGKLTSREYGCYDGPWLNDVPHGLNGTRIYPDGSVYTGEWHYGKRWGTGILRLPSGEIRFGEWVNDEQHGVTTIKNRGKRTKVGVSDHGKFTKIKATT